MYLSHRDAASLHTQIHVDKKNTAHLVKSSISDPTEYTLSKRDRSAIQCVEQSNRKNSSLSAKNHCISIFSVFTVTKTSVQNQHVCYFKKFVKIINSRVTISASFPETYHFVPSFSRDEDLGPWERARKKKTFWLCTNNGARSLLQWVNLSHFVFVVVWLLSAVGRINQGLIPNLRLSQHLGFKVNMNS